MSHTIVKNELYRANQFSISNRAFIILSCP